MKIAMLIYSLQGGGAERVVSILANAFINKGSDVVVFVFNSDNQAYQLSKDIKIIPVNIRGKSRLSKILLRLESLREGLNREKPDVLLAFAIKNVPYALFASARRKTKVIGLERTNPKVHGFLLQLIIRYVSPRCDGFIYQTEGAKLCYPSKIREKAVVISNPIDARGYRKEQYDSTTFRMCSVGRLHPVKDYEMLIQAFSIYRRSGGMGSLDIVGEGDKREELESLVRDLNLEESVQFVGFVHDIQRRLCEYDLFVFSSKMEGMPNALMEAMAVGLPCISTDCEFGPGELIESGRNGLLVPVGDAEKMAEAIRWMENHKDERGKMGREARKITDKYSVDRVVDEYMDYIDSVMNCQIN